MDEDGLGGRRQVARGGAHDGAVADRVNGGRHRRGGHVPCRPDIAKYDGRDHRGRCWPSPRGRVARTPSGRWEPPSVEAVKIVHPGEPGQAASYHTRPTQPGRIWLGLRDRLNSTQSGPTATRWIKTGEPCDCAPNFCTVNTVSAGTAPGGYIGGGQSSSEIWVTGPLAPVLKPRRPVIP